LTEKYPKILGKKLSHTTRQPQEGEVQGEHYFFVTKDEYNVSDMSLW
jgi:THO complex subunit 1